MPETSAVKLTPTEAVEKPLRRRSSTETAASRSGIVNLRIADPLCGLHTVWLARVVAKNADHTAKHCVAADRSEEFANRIFTKTGQPYSPAPLFSLPHFFAVCHTAAMRQFTGSYLDDRLAFSFLVLLTPEN